MGVRCAVALTLWLSATAGAAPFLSFVESHASVAQRGTPLVSPDGAHVYVGGTVGDDWLLAYERDGVTGALSLVQTLRDDAGGIDGLHRPGSFVLSPDAKHLYVAGDRDDGTRAISVFVRNPSTGMLTLDSWVIASPTLGAAALAMSPDGLHLYATVASQNGGRGLRGFTRDPSSGGLTPIVMQSESVKGSGFAVSPDGAHVYAAGGLSLWVFARNAVTGVLTLVDESFPSHPLNSLVVSPDGAHVYVGGDDPFIIDRPQQIARYDRDPVTGLLTLAEVMDDAPGAFMSMDAAGTHLYAASLDDETTVYERDPGTGVLTVSQTGVTAGRMSLSPDGQNAYARLPSGIAVFDRDGLDGTLTSQPEVSGEVGTPLGLLSARRGVIAPDGTHLYVLGDDLGVWSRDATTGALTFVELLTEAGAGIPGLHDADGLAITPDGGHVLVLNGDDQLVVVLARDALMGTLTLVETQQQGVGGVTGLGDPRGAAVTADGLHVYVAGPGTPGHVAHFTRNPGTGALTFVDETVLPDFIAAIVSPVLSPDDLNLYVPRSSQETFTLARDPGSGALSFVAQSAGGDGLVATADGRHLYARGKFGTPNLGTSVQALARSSPSSGLGVLGEVPLPGGGAGRQDLAMDPHGVYVWSVGYSNSDEDDGFVFVLTRNPDKGGLALIETVQDGVGGFTDLEGATGVVVSPDGRHLYVMARGDDALVVLAMTECSTFFAGSGAKLKLSRVGIDPDPTNDVLQLKGKMLLRGVDFADLDPLTNGGAVRVERADGSTVIDVALPAGAFAGAGTAGWKTNAAGSKWLYVDKTPLPPGGIKKLLLKDAGRRTPRLVKLSMRGKKGSYPVVAGDEPLAVSVGLGLPTACLATGFAAEDCSFNASQTAVQCR
jgi:6-phosphogluconolactonase (cycloisomerase 2 family)